MMQRNAIEIRPAMASDAAAISRVVIRTLRMTNARDYTPDVIERLAATFTPQRFLALIISRPVYVALAHGTISGTANLDGAAPRAVFVDPDHQGQGIGAGLMAAIENLARIRAVPTLYLQSSVTAEGFYRKLGYVAVGDGRLGAERTIMMQKSLRWPIVASH
jgi:GNAT superfamily N-acetyltransferase